VSPQILGGYERLSITRFEMHVCIPLYIMISAPHLKGYWRGGGAKVASTTRRPPQE